MVTYKIPPRFWQDSYECGVGPELIKSTKTYVIVDGSKSDIEELVDRCFEYLYGDYPSEYNGLVKSADATLTALKKQGFDIDAHAIY